MKMTTYQAKQVMTVGSLAGCWTACALDGRWSLDQNQTQVRAFRVLTQMAGLSRPPEDPAQLLEWLHGMHHQQAHNLLQALREKAARAVRLETLRARSHAPRSIA